MYYCYYGDDYYINNVYLHFNCIIINKRNVTKMTKSYFYILSKKTVIK